MASSAEATAHNVYLAAIEPRSGKSLVALGLMEVLSRRLAKMGYFRPVVASAAVPDTDIELIRHRYRLAQTYAESYAVAMDELRAMGDRDRYDVLLKRILESFRRLDQATDLVLVEGGDFTGASRALELDFNAELANHMGCLVLLVVLGGGRSVEEVLDAAGLAHGSLTGRGCTILATVCTGSTQRSPGSSAVGCPRWSGTSRPTRCPTCRPSTRRRWPRSPRPCRPGSCGRPEAATPPAPSARSATCSSGR
jgi:hypothetical protein